MIRFCSYVFSMLASPAWADFSGRVTVVDGDTIHVGSVTVRLHCIDAPEIAQMCEDAQGVTWACGVFVTQQVAERYGGRTARCTQIDRDRYGRSVAKCFVDGVDIAEEIVLSGWAEAYRRYSYDYDLAEKTAQVRGAGLWSGTLQSPAAYRADQRAASPGASPPDGSCIIKGNISSSGRIYHMPHN